MRVVSVSGGCKVGKQVYREGEHFVSKEDRCAQCQCKVRSSCVELQDVNWH